MIKAGFFFAIILIIEANPQIHAEVLSRMPVIANIDFENQPTGSFGTLDLGKVILKSNNGEDRILGKGGRIQSQCLYITGGDDHILEFSLVDGDIPIQYISFRGQKLSSEIPFYFIVEAFSENKWHEMYSEDSVFTTDRLSDAVYISFPQTEVFKFRIRCSSPENGGLLLDDLILLDNSLMEVMEVNTNSLKLPVLIDKPLNGIKKIIIETEGEANPRLLENITIGFDQPGDAAMFNSLTVHYTGSNPEFNAESKIAEINNPGKHQKINLSQTLHHGKNYFWVAVSLSDKSDIRSCFYSFIEEVIISGLKYDIKEEDPGYKHRLGLALRDHNEDGVHTYRIPGLVTTNNGTLIAVYDIRRNSSTDLQGDIDVGMSRSIDGGQSWEKMKVIMDLGEWGGLSEEENGIGDPSVLVDKQTNTIWVAGIWAHGHKNRRNWTESKPGLDPSQTSQLMLVNSTDDGKTWNDPVNITTQVKKEEWPLLLQGPGKGITLSDGTLVFPAQYKDHDHIPHSTIIWSKDHGITWNIGTGAKSNTTESQVIELDNGDLMLNMRDNRNREDKSDLNGRSVAISSDLGKTWVEDNKSKGVLIEPVCMASIIKDNFEINNNSLNLVLFSNPASKYQRENISIRLSFDDGQTWPEKYVTLLDEGVGRGYSCMTKIDEQTIGILYESSKADLVYQFVNIEDIINSVD
jgi:sialidase-1